MLLYTVGLATQQGIAAWYFDQGTAEALQKAIEWEPANPKYYAARAKALQFSLQGVDIPEVVRLYETATQLNPNKARYWMELGAAYEWTGREEEAERAYNRARELFPNSPAIHWKLGNFYLRFGERDNALRALQMALQGDPELRHPAFDLVWRAGLDHGLILSAMIPTDTGTLLAYLDYLAQKQHLDAAGEVWARILESGPALEPQEAFSYLDALIQGQRVDELRTAWAALFEHSPSQVHPRRSDRNLIANGSFESEILNGGLDWRIAPVEGVVVSVDSLVFFDGAHSLRVQFEGKHNLDYSHVVQYVPVRPNTTYRLMGYMHAQGITTDSGPRFQIYDAYDLGRFSVSTEAVLGTSNWSPQQLQFTTGPETRLLILRVIRPASHKFDNQISGTIWLDRLSLNAVD